MTAAVMAAGPGPSPLWYATRATGVVALVLLTVTVVLGIAGVARVATPRWPRIVTAGLHRNLSLLVVCFLAVHITTALADTYAPLGWTAAVLPFVSPYRPLWLGLGTLAFDLVAAMVITSLIRVRLGRGAWRAVHWAAYAAWPAALWHGLGTGTDTRLPWLLAIDAVCLLAVAAAVAWRLSLAAGTSMRRAGITVSAAVPLATIAFATAGPLRPGWAVRAGTPPALLRHTAVTPGAPQRPGGTATAPASAGSGPASAPFEGKITRSEGAGTAVVTVTARTAGPVRQRLRVVLRGTPDGGGITLSSGRVRVVPPGAGQVFGGPVTGLDGSVVTATLTGPGGFRAAVTITLSISGTTVTGRLHVAPGGGR